MDALLGMGFSSPGSAAGLAILDALGGGVPPFWGFRLYESRSGLQSNTDYPPLQRLREEGWIKWRPGLHRTPAHSI